jgi:hypothetical protein
MTEYAEQHPVGLGEALKMLFDPATMAANEKLAQSPPFVKHQLMDPYLYGLGFIRTCKVHGWKDIDAIYLDPPQSGKQVMHPEKYAPVRDEPTIIELPDVSAALKEGKWEKKIDTVIGEDYVVALVESWGEILKDEKLTSSAERMAKGWNGDRLVSFENPDGERVVVWISTWETKRAADEMAAALKKWIEKWAGGEKTKNGIRDTDVRQQAGKDGRGFDVICTQSLTYGRSAPAWVRTIGAGYKTAILRAAQKQPAAAK